MAPTKTSFWSGILALLYTNKVLKLILVRNSKGEWGIPGGGSNPNETPTQTAAREAEEEASIRFDHTDLTLFDIFEDCRYVYYTFIDEYRGRPIKEDDEIKEARLFTLKEALKLNLKYRDRTYLTLFSAIATNSNIEKMVTKSFVL